MFSQLPRDPPCALGGREAGGRLPLSGPAWRAIEGLGVERDTLVSVFLTQTKHTSSLKNFLFAF